MQITSGITKRPVKCIVYGAEGVGKTTFASMWPDPLFIDTEGGSTYLDVRRVSPAPSDWNTLIQYVAEISLTPNICQTIVIDTIDWAEQLCLSSVCEEHKVESIEAIPYGRGYTYSAEKMKELLSLLSECIANGKNVLVLAHAQIKKFEQPDEMGAYDRWELKLAKKCGPILKEWCDLLLFANFKTDLVKDDNGKYRPAGGKRRVMYTSHTAAYDAKNRLGLLDEMPFEFAAIADKVPTMGQPQPATPINAVAMQESAADLSKLTYTDATPPEVKSLWELMDMDGITKEQVMRAVGEGQNNPYTVDTTIGEYDPAFVRDVLVAHWGQIASGIKERAAYEAPVPFD